jgi:predicted Zn-dependent protease
MPTRTEILLGFIAQRPDDPFPRYGLAMEYKNAGQLNEAWDTFRMLLGEHPDYVPAYLHAGATLVALGRSDEARVVYQNGIAACSRRGDPHARGELEGALAGLAEPPPGGAS